MPPHLSLTVSGKVYGVNNKGPTFDKDVNVYLNYIKKYSIESVFVQLKLPLLYTDEEMLSSVREVVKAYPRVDIGAATAIRQKLLDLSQSGKAVILISQDLEEIFELSDKICVINEGVLSEIFDVREITATDVGLLMGGKNRENQQRDPII